MTLWSVERNWTEKVDDIKIFCFALKMVIRCDCLLTWPMNQRQKAGEIHSLAWIPQSIHMALLDFSGLLES